MKGVQNEVVETIGVVPCTVAWNPTFEGSESLFGWGLARPARNHPRPLQWMPCRSTKTAFGLAQMLKDQAGVSQNTGIVFSFDPSAPVWVPKSDFAATISVIDCRVSQSSFQSTLFQRPFPTELHTAKSRWLVALVGVCSFEGFFPDRKHGTRGTRPTTSLREAWTPPRIPARIASWSSWRGLRNRQPLPPRRKVSGKTCSATTRRRVPRRLAEMTRLSLWLFAWIWGPPLPSHSRQKGLP